MPDCRRGTSCTKVRCGRWSVIFCCAYSENLNIVWNKDMSKMLINWFKGKSTGNHGWFWHVLTIKYRGFAVLPCAGARIPPHSKPVQLRRIKGLSYKDQSYLIRPLNYPGWISYHRKNPQKPWLFSGKPWLFCRAIRLSIGRLFSVSESGAFDASALERLKGCGPTFTATWSAERLNKFRAFGLIFDTLVMLCLKTIQNIEGPCSNGRLLRAAIFYVVPTEGLHKEATHWRPWRPRLSLSVFRFGLAWFSARHSAAAHNDVVDGDEDQLHGVSNEAHDGETNGTGHRDLLELLGIRLGASLNQTARVHAKLNGTLHAVANWVVLVGQEGRHSRQLGGHCFF